jgi:hypothetical protein
MLPPLPKTPPAQQARNAISALYYKPIMIVNDDSSVVNNLKFHLLTTLELTFTIGTCL